MSGYDLNYDFSQIAPNTGANRTYFPVSDAKGWLCQLVDTEAKENSNKNGMILACQLQGLEGPVAGKTHDFSINLANPNPKATEIGAGELSAIGHVTGRIRVGNTREWHNIPIRVLVVPESEEQQAKYPGSTRLAGFRDVNGNKPGEAGHGVSGGFTTQQSSGFVQQGQQTQPQQTQQQGGFVQQTPQQGGFVQQTQQHPDPNQQANGQQTGQQWGNGGGAPLNTQQTQQTQQMPALNPNGNGGGFGGPANGQQPQQGGFQQDTSGRPAWTPGPTR